MHWLVWGTGKYIYWLSHLIPIPLRHLNTSSAGSCQWMTAGRLGRR